MDVVVNEMGNLPRGIGSRSAGGRGCCGACAVLWGNTESAARSVDIGDITVKITKSYVQLRPTCNEKIQLT